MPRVLVEGGLFHPRCKDSTSTYFEGITTLKPVSEEEMREMERREQLEQKESYCRNEAKKNRRISKYSLDPDNKRIYAKRAEAFEEKAEKIEKTLENSGESGIIKAAGNNRGRNIELEKTIHRCISSDKPIFAEGSLGKNALRIQPLLDTYDVIAHGLPDSALVFDTQITPKIMANILKSRKDYVSGTPVRLISCNTGSANSQGDCFAQKLADLLNVKVSAPNHLIWVYPNGDLAVGSTPGSRNGKMIDFYPRGEIK